MRRFVGGMPCIVLAMLVLLARLLVPSMGMADAGAGAATLGVICHVPDPQDGDQGPAHSSEHDHACLLCPACHVVAQAWLPEPPAGLITVALGGLIGRAAPPPPATGPPRQPRVAAQPTGPPVLSV